MSADYFGARGRGKGTQATTTNGTFKFGKLELGSESGEGDVWVDTDMDGGSEADINGDLEDGKEGK